MKKKLYIFVSCFCSLTTLFSEIWNVDNLGNWSTSTNWNPQLVPNAFDATATFGSVITAPRTITVDGTFSLGTLNIDNANAYTLSGGTLNINGPVNITNTNGNASHSISSNLLLEGDSTVTQDSTSNVTISGTISGTKSLTKEGSGTLIITSTSNSYSGGTTVSAGTLQGNQASIQGDIINNGAVVITNFTQPSGTYSGNMSGTGSLTKDSNSGLTLTGTNTYSGGTTIAGGGRLDVSSNENLGDPSGVINLTNGNFVMQGSFTSNRTISVEGASASIALTPFNGVTFTQAGNITGLGNVNSTSLRKFNGGTLVLSGNNDFRINNFRLFAGTVRVSSDSNMGDTSVILRLIGGTLNTTATFTSTRNYLLESTGTINTDDSTTFTISGVMSGTGTFTKTGSGTLTLSGTNTYSGGTTLSAGTISIGADANLGTGNLVFNGGTLNTSATFSTSKPMGTSSEATINTDTNTTFTISGVVSGANGLTKTGNGTLVLSGTNTYSGDTTLSTGVVSVAADANLGSGDLTFNGGTLNTSATFSMSKGASLSDNATIDTDTSTTLTMSGVIAGAKDLTKTGDGTLILSGANTYTGSTTIEGGTLELGGTSPGPLEQSSSVRVNSGNLVISSGSGNKTVKRLSGNGNVNVNNNTLVVNQSSDTTFGGVISGTGGLTKLGSGTLTLTGANTLSGIATVSAGILAIDGSMPSSTLNVNGGRLKGSGNLGTLTINGGELNGNGTYNSVNIISGTVRPGDSIGTITITGDYTQGAGAVYEVEIEGSTSDRIIATGQANIDGAAILTVLSPTGNFFEGTTYDILTASGGINQLWGTVNFPTGFEFNLELINGTIARLTLLNTLLFVGQIIDPGNPTAVDEYLKCLNIIPGSDLETVVNAADSLDDRGLNKALNLLHPALFAAFELANLDSLAFINSILAEQLIELSCSERNCFQNTRNKKNNLWISPFGSFTNVGTYQQLRSFDTKGGGVLLGYDHCLPKNFLIGAGAGYEYTCLSWDNNNGDSNIQRAVGAIYGGYHIKHLIIDAAVTAGANFYDVTRNIRFATINRTAKNHHTGYFAAPHLGLNVNTMHKKLLLEAFGALDYIYLYQSSYCETGADSINLAVNSKDSHMLRPEIGGKLSGDVSLSKGCIKPFVGVSWVRKIPLSNDRYSAEFKDFTNEDCTLTVETFDKGKNFVSPQAGMFYTINAFTLSGIYKGEFSNNYQVNQFDVKLQWVF